MVWFMLYEQDDARPLGVWVARIWCPGDSYTATILCTFNSVQTCFYPGESFFD